MSRAGERKCRWGVVSGERRGGTLCWHIPDAATQRERASRGFAALSPAALLVLTIDSLLRGNTKMAYILPSPIPSLKQYFKNVC